MLENYFLQLDQSSSINCRQTTLPGGFKFPLPSSGITGGINIKEVKTIIMEQNSMYPPTYNAVFLPYVKNNINLCIQSNKDVLSAPFTGCHMVRFYYTGDCLLAKIKQLCKDQKYGCQLTCKYRYKTFVGHIAYEDQYEGVTCKDIWENDIKRYCSHVIDFDPFPKEIELFVNKNGPIRVHGLITKDGRKFSIGIDYNDKISFVQEY
ncbi:hypothetical protein K0F25_08830 [Bacteroides fragilis]|nr:hypothetical protein [Bacteroides fragilis]